MDAFTRGSIIGRRERFSLGQVTKHDWNIYMDIEN
jgi:hypothetical protein